MVRLFFKREMKLPIPPIELLTLNSFVHHRYAHLNKQNPTFLIRIGTLIPADLTYWCNVKEQGDRYKPSLRVVRKVEYIYVS
jgi:hypothetical protein